MGGYRNRMAQMEQGGIEIESMGRDDCNWEVFRGKRKKVTE